MKDDWTEELHRRAAVHAALGDPARLGIVDTLRLGDASPSELTEALGLSSNLLAHHLNVLAHVGLVARHRSEGDRRRTYVQLLPGALERSPEGNSRAVPRVLFVCTANAARSHMATALWKRASRVPAVSAGTHPADAIALGAKEAARRHGYALLDLRPKHLSQVHDDGDLVVTVCDRAREELDLPVAIHWSVPDPLLSDSPDAFDNAWDELGRRVDDLARLTTLTSPARN